MIKDRNIDPDANISMSKLGIGGTVFGDRFYVDYTNGSDNFDGKSKSRAVKTLSHAYSLVATNNNDAIFVAGYASVVETSMISWTKSRIHVFGDNGPAPGLGYGPGAKISIGGTSASNTALITNTGTRNTFNALKFSNSNTNAASLQTIAEGGEYTRYNHCEFYHPSLLTTDHACEVLMNGDSSQFYGCTFGDLVNERGASGKERPNVQLTREQITGKVCRDGTFAYCTFLTKAAHADAGFFHGVNANDVERRLVLVRPIFWNAILASATVADAVDFDTAQTAGAVLLVSPSAINVTALGGANLGVYVTGPVPTESTTGIAVEVAT